MKRWREERELLERLMLRHPQRRIPRRQPSSSGVKFVALDPKLVYLRIVLGGTAASHTCSGVGGGHFLIKGRRQDPHSGIEPTVRPFDL